jgi:hypothetical protein
VFSASREELRLKYSLSTGDMDFAPSGHHTSQAYADHIGYDGAKLLDAHNTAPSPHHPNLTPLSLTSASLHPDSAPTTACSTDSSGGASGWPSYTPPSTATSGTSISTNLSGGGSPVFPTSMMGGAPGAGHPYKGDAQSGGVDDTFYHMAVAADLDQFSFSAGAGTGQGEYHHPVHRQQQQQQPSGYLDFTAAGGPTSVLVHPGSDEANGCPQFGDDCSGYYH